VEGVIARGEKLRQHDVYGDRANVVGREDSDPSRRREHPHLNFTAGVEPAAPNS
jgi:hypothetical protein